MVVRLQIKDDRWRTTKTWTDKNGTQSAEIDESYISKISGDYRLWVEYNAYDGSDELVESITEYSDVIHVDVN